MASHARGSYVSTRARAQLLGGLLVGSALLCWVAVGYDIADGRLLGQEAAGQALEPGRKHAYQATGYLVQSAQLFLLGITGLVFVEWLYQSRANLRAFGVRQLRYGRGWAVGAFLVPGLNLFRPYAVIREVWQASDPASRDPFAWTRVRPNRLLPVWWGVFVAWGMLALAALAMALGADHDAGKLQGARFVATVADVCAAIGASLAYFVVEHISESQEEKRGVGPREGVPALGSALEAH